MGVQHPSSAMTHNDLPKRVLITGGREIGGLASFAEGLHNGFLALGIPSEIIAPKKIISRRNDLRDPAVLKILSTEAVFAATVSRRAICVAHGIPRVDAQGWRRLSGIIASFKIANRCSGIQLVSVSHYIASTLRAIFNIHSHAVIHNPLKPIFLEPFVDAPEERRYITYVGRLDTAKNIHRILPTVKDFLDENSGMAACIIGNGNQKKRLEEMVSGDNRFKFQGTPSDDAVRGWLRKTRIFFSGNEVEGFGISYLEAMTQGCIVAMPAGGGGIEIAPSKVGESVQLLPLSWERQDMLRVFRKCLVEKWKPIDTERFTVKSVARSYLAVDSRFSPDGYAPPR